MKLQMLKCVYISNCLIGLIYKVSVYEKELGNTKAVGFLVVFFFLL